MADSILSSLRSKALLTIVSNGATGAEDNLAKNLKVTNVSIKYSARAMRHMLEDGTTIVDARIIDPTMVELEVICPTLDELNNTNQMLRDRKNTFKLTSKGIIVNNVVCEAFKIQQTSEMLSASPVRISMKQILRQGMARVGQVVEQPADSSLIGQGIQTMQKVTASVQETFRRVIGG